MYWVGNPCLLFSLHKPILPTNIISHLDQHPPPLCWMTEGSQNPIKCINVSVHTGGQGTNDNETRSRRNKTKSTSYTTHLYLRHTTTAKNTSNQGHPLRKEKVSRGREKSQIKVKFYPNIIQADTPSDTM